MPNRFPCQPFTGKTLLSLALCLSLYFPQGAAEAPSPKEVLHLGPVELNLASLPAVEEPSGFSWDFVHLGDASRPALWGQAPYDWSRRVTLPPQARLKGALGFRGQGKGARFVISLKKNGRVKTTFQRRIKTPGQWEEFSLSLAPWAGERVELHFQVTPLSPGDQIAAGWGDPLIRSQTGNPLNVILYVVDTLRADALPAYGASGLQTPHLDRLAAQSLVFDRCYATSNYTALTVPSIEMGVPTSFHRNSLKSRESATAPINTLETLAQNLRRQGYSTALFETYPPARKKFFGGKNRGFAHLHHYQRPPEQRGRETVPDAVYDWLGRQDRQPFYLHLHTNEPHDPYRPPAPFALPEPAEPVSLESIGKQMYVVHPQVSPKQAAALRRLYDGEIQYLDHNVGKFLKYLKKKKLLENTLLVFTSDHGEEFLEHKYLGHGKTLCQHQIHVPLFIYHPRLAAAGRRVPEPVSSADIMPTVLELLGQRIPPTVRSQSLSPWFNAKHQPPPSRVVISEMLKPIPMDPEEKILALAGQSRHWKVIYNLFDKDSPLWQVYSLDPQGRPIEDFSGKPLPPAAQKVQDTLSQWREQLQGRLGLSPSPPPQ